MAQPDAPAPDAHRSSARQRPWHVVANVGSGVAARERLRLLQRALSELLPASTLRAVGGHELADALAEAATAARADGGCLGICGGDGSLNAAAAVALRHDLPLLVLPGGTYNYYTRSLGLPDALDAAVRQLAGGSEQRADVGFVNDRPFLVNLSLGLHSHLLQQRERDMSRLGRGRIVAVWSALKSLAGSQRSRRLRIEGDGLLLQGPMVAVLCSRNPVQLADLSLSAPPAGQLCLVHALGQGRWKTLAAAAALLLGQARRTPEIGIELGEHFRISAARRPRSRLHLGVDGELLRLPGPLEVRVERDRLRLWLPAATTSTG